MQIEDIGNFNGGRQGKMLRRAVLDQYRGLLRQARHLFDPNARYSLSVSLNKGYSWPIASALDSETIYSNSAHRGSRRSFRKEINGYND